MCGRYTLICIDDLGVRFRLYDPTLGFRSRFNIAPGQVQPVITRQDSARVVEMVWGLIPGRTKNPTATRNVINARMESLKNQPMFSRLLADRRCLIPATGFYEWTIRGRHKTPFYFRLKQSRLFAFAGLHDTWTDPGGMKHPRYVIITTAPNHLVAPVHNRMPAILRSGDETRWLSGDPLSSSEMNRILSPFPAEEMEGFPVSPNVNRPGANDESLIRPLATLA